VLIPGLLSDHRRHAGALLARQRERARRSLNVAERPPTINRGVNIQPAQKGSSFDRR
jgi:hypothetical protein